MCYLTLNKKLNNILTYFIMQLVIAVMFCFVCCYGTYNIINKLIDNHTVTCYLSSLAEEVISCSVHGGIAAYIFLTACNEGRTVLSHHKDKELIQQCLSGSEDAWSQLYRRIYMPVHFITHWKKWNFSHDDAQEIMQEVFMNMITAIRTFNFECSIETFASNIAKNKCISEIRRICAQKREGEQNCMSLYDPDKEGTMRTALEDRRSSFLEQVETAEAYSALESGLQRLNERCRSIIRLKYYEDRSYEDICFLLSLPMGTVASRLKRCLEELSDLCEK